MDKQQKQLIIAGVLIIALIFSVMNSLRKKPKKKASLLPETPAESSSPGATADSSSGQAVNNNKLSVQQERLKLPWGRDPFAEPSEREYQIGELELKGISFGKDKKGFAFINNEIVRKGDKVGSYEVVEVEKDKVLLKKGNQDFYLAFPIRE